eukprot:3383387-Rhodomonas_salina.1
MVSYLALELPRLVQLSNRGETSSEASSDLSRNSTKTNERSSSERCVPAMHLRHHVQSCREFAMDDFPRTAAGPGTDQAYGATGRTTDDDFDYSESH